MYAMWMRCTDVWRDFSNLKGKKRDPSCISYATESGSNDKVNVLHNWEFENLVFVLGEHRLQDLSSLYFPLDVLTFECVHFTEIMR